MKKQFFGLVVAICALIASPSRATVVTFDDVTLNSTGKITDGYAGLSWNHFGYSSTTEWAKAVVSSPMVAYNMGGLLPSIYANETPSFTFNGASFTSLNNERLTILITGYTTEGEKYGTVVLNPSSPVTATFDWVGVTTLNFWPIGSIPNTYFAIDNLRINEPVSDVPLPAALPLFGSGLLALVAATRKRKA